MKIVLLVSRAAAGGSETAGTEIDVDEAEARRLIAHGQARPVRQRRKAETAVQPDRAEKAHDE